MKVRIEHGNCLDVMRRLADEGVQVDAIVTDPPYGLEFMGKDWDAPWQLGGKSALFGKRETATPGGWGGTRNANCRACGGRLRGSKRCQCPEPDWDEAPEATRTRQMRAFQDWCEDWATLALALLKPGGHLVAFGGTRTAHRMVCAIEDAGFEVRDGLCWLYGTGFPKSHNVGGGWGTALKPAHEPICLARKPLALPTVAAQVLATGTGALNIDACRVPTDENLNGGAYSGGGKRREDASSIYMGTHAGEYVQPPGRWPANVAHDGSDEVLEAFARYGERGGGFGTENRADGTGIYGKFSGATQGRTVGFGDTGTAARFFYSAKASRADRAGSKHPTVKPVALMRWLCRLVTPPGGVILDPFAGSGTTGQAAREEGFDAILIEREAEYLKDIKRRLVLLEAADLFA